jgi:hypothetical protein
MIKFKILCHLATLHGWNIDWKKAKPPLSRVAIANMPGRISAFHS